MRDIKPREPVMMVDPLVIIYKGPDKKLITAIHGDRREYDHRAYGLIICDLVRHVAKAYGVSEDSVWEWVEKERERPTTTVEGGPRQ